MAGPKRLAPIRPSERNVKRANFRAKTLGPLTGLWLRPRFALDVHGRENVPRKGPALILSNHVGFFDPVQLIIAAHRNIHFMTTQATMTDPMLGRVMQLFGAVPKQKAVADPRAIQGMRDWAKLGAMVGLFPEGERTWDGRPLPILPGIERLVRLLRVPVITARIENADHVTPRWALRARRGRIRITFDAPQSFERKTPLPEIRSFIETRLAVDPAQAQRWPVNGKYLARGVSNVLFACPACQELEGLREENEHVECRACKRSWRVTADAHLEGEGEREPLYGLVPAMHAHFAKKWDAAVDAEPGAFLFRSLDAVELMVDDEQHELIATGRLEVYGDHLQLVLGKEVPWRVEIDGIAAMTVELTRRLQLVMRDGRRFEFAIPRESVLKFKGAVDHLLSRIRKR